MMNKDFHFFMFLPCLLTIFIATHGFTKHKQTGHKLIANQEVGSSTLEVIDFNAGQFTILDKSVVSHLFVIKVKNNKPIRLNSFSTSCDCTSAFLIERHHIKRLPATLVSGQPLGVLVKVDLNKVAPGPFSKEVFLVGNGNALPFMTLHMSGILQPVVAYSPSLLDFGHCRFDNNQSLQLNVLLDKRMLSLTDSLRLISDNPDLSLIPERNFTSHTSHAAVSGINQPAILKSYRVILSPHAHLGLISGQISLAFASNLINVEALSFPHIPIMGEITGDITASPKAVIFSNVPIGKEVTEQIHLSSTALEMLNGLKVETQSSYIFARFLPADAGTENTDDERILEITVSDKAPVGTIESHIIITTTQGERLSLPIIANITHTI